jgi:hypothetical protein
MNDKPDREKLIGSILSKTVVCEEHLKKVPEFLERSGCTPKFRAEVQMFLSPLIGILAEMEREVIQVTRMEQINEMLTASVRDSQTAALQAWGDVFSRLSNSPESMRAAQEFKKYIADFIKEPNKVQEPNKDKDRTR